MEQVRFVAALGAALALSSWTPTRASGGGQSFHLPPPNAQNSAKADFGDVDGDGDALVSNENPFIPSPTGGERVFIRKHNGHHVADGDE